MDEHFPALLYCYLEEVPAEPVIASPTFITKGDVLRILDWLQHLPPQRRMLLDLQPRYPSQGTKESLAWGWVPATIAAHPAVRSRGFRVDLHV